VTVLALVLLLAAKSKVEVIASPLISIADLSGGATVRFRVSILNPEPEMSCPTVTFDWPDGTKSEVEADCEPCETAPCPEFGPVIRSQRFGVGDGTVSVTLRQGKSIRKHSVSFRVIG
jgi:hypothetical protein